MSFNDRIEYILKIKGLNNRDLSKKIEVHETTVSRWRKTDKPSMDFILKLIDVFPEIDLNFLLKEKKENNINEYTPMIPNHVLSENIEEYKYKNEEEIITDIQENLNKLKEIVAQKNHK